MNKLTRDFYTRADTLSLCREILGCTLFRQTPGGAAAGRIVEVEAYIGPDDGAAHSFCGKRTARTELAYGPGGYAYVYLIYGMYCCLNIVTSGPEKPEMLLIRALEPVEGLELMGARRGKTKPLELCSGPGKLCMAMDITTGCYGMDLCGDELYVLERELVPEIVTGERVNIGYAGAAVHYPWRFAVKGSPFVSVKKGLE